MVVDRNTRWFLNHRQATGFIQLWCSHLQTVTVQTHRANQLPLTMAGLSGWMASYKPEQKRPNLVGQENHCRPNILQKQEKVLWTAVRAYATHSPTCHFLSYSVDTLHGLFCPTSNGHFNGPIWFATLCQLDRLNSSPNNKQLPKRLSYH